MGDEIVPKGAQAEAPPASAYDAIAGLYDAWSRSVTEDVAFYVDEAVAAGGPVVELGIGTGRVGIPIARAGVDVIGVDNSPGMLAVCRAHAEAAGVGHRLELRLGDLAAPPVPECVRLVVCPFRSYLHLGDDRARVQALRAARELLVPGGRLIFDVFTPSRDDIAETHGRWLEREAGIWERAEWDTRRRTLTLSVRGAAGETTMVISWAAPSEWRCLLERAGFEVVACYGWFDRREFTGLEDVIFVGRRPRLEAR